MTKDKKFQSSKTINAKGILLDLSTTQVMGILNITFDSFYDGGKNNTLSKAIEKAHQFIKEEQKLLILVPIHLDQEQNTFQPRKNGID